MFQWLLQVSLRESKEGSEAKLEASKMFSRVIAAGLHRVAAAMAKDSECITKASKVGIYSCLHPYGLAPASLLAAPATQHKLH